MTMVGHRERVFLREMFVGLGFCSNMFKHTSQTQLIHILDNCLCLLLDSQLQSNLDFNTVLEFFFSWKPFAVLKQPFNCSDALTFNCGTFNCFIPDCCFCRRHLFHLSIDIRSTFKDVTSDLFEPRHKSYTTQFQTVFNLE